jgi:carbon storage regulator CsrA
MLVLDRKLDQGFTIRTAQGETIRVVVNGVPSWHRVKLGIDAPAGVLVMRDEVLDRAREEAG